MFKLQKSFTPRKNRDSRYCSKKCQAGRYGTVIIICETCANEFTVAYRFRAQKFCNAKCQGIAASKRSTSVFKKCLNCSEDFKVTKLREDIVKYCSTDCFYKHAYQRESKFITLTCEYCKEEYDTLFIHRARRFCSKKCANTGENNAMFGKPGSMLGKKAWNNSLTTKTDDRLRILGRKISSLQKQQFIEGIRSNVGDNNPNYGRTRDTRSNEQLENYSKAAIQRVVDGKSCSHKSHIRGNYHSKKMNKTFFYRSSYELRLMNCYEKDSDIVSFEHEPFSIHYDIGRRYLPDFLVINKSGVRYLIEAKPAEFVAFADVVRKSNAAIEYCSKNGMSFAVFTGSDIDNLEIMLGIKKNEWKLYIESGNENISTDTSSC